MKKRRRPISDINVVPYLDVMLVLLVIFMITAPLFNQGVVDLPSVNREVPLSPQEAGAMEIVYDPDAENPYMLINHKHGEESAQLSLPELAQKLEDEKLLRPDAEVPIAISVGEDAKYGEVVKLLGELRAKGFERIGFVAENEQ